LCRRTLEIIKEAINPKPKDEYDYTSGLVIANLECMFNMGHLKEAEFQEKMSYFLSLQRKDIDD
jgi:hypothetical protein